MASPYFKLLDKISNDYRGVYNLKQLKSYNQKIGCYKSHNAKPQLYYECFDTIQRQNLQNSKQIQASYQVIDDDFKLCMEGCKLAIGDQAEECRKKCGVSYEQSVVRLYDEFYKNKVGGMSEYKKVKPK